MSNDERTPTSPSPLGIDRAALLARVRAALDRSGPPPEPPATPPALEASVFRLAEDGGDVVALFAERAAAVGMTVHRTTTRELIERIRSIVSACGAARIAVSLGETALRADLATAMAAAGIDLVDWRTRGGLDAHYNVDAGITDVEAALAESGTLIVAADADHSRGTALVPPVHVAVLRGGDVVPDMIDYWGARRGRPMPSSLLFITGPSKTADIEGVLVTGVHGPREVHVVLVDDERPRDRASSAEEHHPAASPAPPARPGGRDPVP